VPDIPLGNLFKGVTCTNRHRSQFSEEREPSTGNDAGPFPSDICSTDVGILEAYTWSARVRYQTRGAEWKRGSYMLDRISVATGCDFSTPPFNSEKQARGSFSSHPGNHGSIPCL